MLKHHHPASFGDSYFNVQVAGEPSPHWPATTSAAAGLPVVEPTWYPSGQKRHLSWQHLPRPSRRPSPPLSTTATASDSRPPSLVMDGSESKTSSRSTSCKSVRLLTLRILTVCCSSPSALLRSKLYHLCNACQRPDDKPSSDACAARRHLHILSVGCPNGT